MKLFEKDLEREIAIIAEIGVNHEGDADKASELLRLAAEAGADVVKFQSYTPERFISSDDPDRLERVKRFAIDEDTHRRLAGEAEELGISFCSSAITEDMVPLISELSGAIKIASGDIDFEPVIRASAATDLPVILSTGNATLAEVDQAVDWVRQEIGDTAIKERLVLMQCVSAYPAPVEQANVAAMNVLRERYGVFVGYSNHVIGPEACYAAVALGASVVEVHFTDQKTGRSFRDHELSFDAADLKDFVAKAPRIRAALGSGDKNRQSCEAESVNALRKGIVAARDIDVGTVLQSEDLMFARPADEFSSGDLDQLVGRKTTSSFNRGQSIRRESVSGE